MTAYNCNQGRSYSAVSGHNPYPTKSSSCSYLKTLASQAFLKFQRINLIREVRKFRSKGKQGFPGSSICNTGDCGLTPRLARSAGEGIGYALQYSLASLVAQIKKILACNAGDIVLIPGLGRSSAERSSCPLQYSCLENCHGQRNLMGYSPWGCKESDSTEHLSVTSQDKMIIVYNTIA